MQKELAYQILVLEQNFLASIKLSTKYLSLRIFLAIFPDCVARIRRVGSASFCRIPGPAYPESDPVPYPFQQNLKFNYTVLFVPENFQYIVKNIKNYDSFETWDRILIWIWIGIINQQSPESIDTLPPFCPIEGHKWVFLNFRPMIVSEEPVCI